MKRLVGLALLGLAVISGCEEAITDKSVRVKEVASTEGPPPLVITPLGDQRHGGSWSQIEYTYRGKTYVYLQSYDGNNQAMVPVTVLDLPAPVK